MLIHHKKTRSQYISATSHTVKFCASISRPSRLVKSTFIRRKTIMFYDPTTFRYLSQSLLSQLGPKLAYKKLRGRTEFIFAGNVYGNIFFFVVVEGWRKDCLFRRNKTKTYASHQHKKKSSTKINLFALWVKINNDLRWL